MESSVCRIVTDTDVTMTSVLYYLWYMMIYSRDLLIDALSASTKNLNVDVQLRSLKLYMMITAIKLYMFKLV